MNENQKKITLEMNGKDALEIPYSIFLDKIKLNKFSKNYLVKDDLLTLGKSVLIDKLTVYKKYCSRDFLKKEPVGNCICFNPKVLLSQFDSKEFGVDTLNGRFGLITILKCKSCSINWIRYFVEFESIRQSGRWYRGIISREEIQKISTEAVIVFFENLNWFFYGGSYFKSKGDLGYFDVSVDN